MRNLRDRDRKIEIRGEAQHYTTGRLQKRKEKTKQGNNEVDIHRHPLH